jgi:glycosyltransferase involved in cell wall biosynthesis
MMNEEKNFLFIAFTFPPQAGSGLQRIMRLTTLLPERGWKPLILTVSRWGNEIEDHTWEAQIPQEIKIFRAISFDPYRWLRLFKLFKLPSANSVDNENAIAQPPKQLLVKLKEFYHKILVPDHSIWWLPGALFCGMYVILKHRPRLILATSGPYGSPIIGTILSKLTGLPLVLDFRDSWVNNPYRDFIGWRLKCETALETFCLKQAWAVVSVTEPIVEAFRQKCAQYQRKPVVNITNGFHYEKAEAPAERVADRIFRIAYTGLFYKNRTPSWFFQGLAQACEFNPDLKNHLRVIIAGKMPAVYIEQIQQPPLKQMVDYRGYLSHSQVKDILNSANVLLLIQSDDDRGFYSSKLFEYLVERKYILALAPGEGIAGKLIDRIGAGMVVEYNDVPAIANAILRLFNDFQAGKLEVKHSLQDIAEFSWPGLADKYSRLLDEVL